MIFVSVGSHLPFDRLVQAVDEWASKNPQADVFMQIGSGSYVPKHAAWTRILPIETYRARLAECDLFIAHVGIGSILQALQAGKRMVLLPRLSRFGEHTSDHQLHTAHRFASNPAIAIAETEADLGRLVSQSVSLGDYASSLSAHASENLLQGVTTFLAQSRERPMTDPDSPVGVALIHPIDPRGRKVGGIETFIRDYIALRPANMQLLLIGVDGFGDLPLGKVTSLKVRGRDVDFFPVMRVPDDVESVPTGSVLKAVIPRLFLSVLRYYFPIKKILSAGKYSLDLRRMELAPLATLFRVPSVQMLHDGATKDKAMSSLIKKFWFVKQMAESYSVKHSGTFYCVNDDLTDRLRREYPKHKNKIKTLPTWANPQIFQVAEYEFDLQVNVFYAGRLDLFKRPDLMFRTIAALKRKRSDVAFHYIGDGNPDDFPEYDEIRDITTRHGRLSSEELARLFRRMHVGILTSDFEGMPRVVMEGLMMGRPFACLHLPQLEKVIKDGVSGYLVERTAGHVEEHADRLHDLYERMRDGRIQPETVSTYVEPFSAVNLLGRLWGDHVALQARWRERRSPGLS